MSTLKHIDEYGISRGFSGMDQNSHMMGMDQSIIDNLVNNGINFSSKGSLIDAFCAINECIEREEHFGGEWPVEAITEIVELLLKDYPDSANEIHYDNAGIDWFYVFEREQQIGLCPEIPLNYNYTAAWVVNIDECTATLACDDGSHFLIELSQRELEYILPDGDDSYENICEVNYQLGNEEDIPYFFSEEETQFIKDDLILKIIAINDILRKYDEKYMLKIKQ